MDEFNKGFHTEKPRFLEHGACQIYIILIYQCVMYFVPCRTGFVLSSSGDAKWHHQEQAVIKKRDFLSANGDSRHQATAFRWLRLLAGPRRIVSAMRRRASCPCRHAQPCPPAGYA